VAASYVVVAMGVRVTPNPRRYPVEPLAAAMGLTVHGALARLSVSGSTQADYRSRGVTYRVADRLAVRAGFHPAEVWPESTEHEIDAISLTCDECETRFIPKARARPDVRFCSKRCNKRFHYRKRYAEAIGERERARSRQFYAENTEYERAQARRRYHANKGAA